MRYFIYAIILIWLLLSYTQAIAMINSFHQTITGDSITCDSEFDSDSQELQVDCVITGVEFDY